MITGRLAVEVRVGFPAEIPRVESVGANIQTGKGGAKFICTLGERGEPTAESSFRVESLRDATLNRYHRTEKAGIIKDSDGFERAGDRRVQFRCLYLNRHHQRAI